ncbi:MAG: D-ribose ABC transporter substrate-binding protein [Spirochaetaceae bacterium]|nr:MAG: D-ribose ABC transporter substrate-binding protein [Spirochaetaceae bacterium]
MKKLIIVALVLALLVPAFGFAAGRGEAADGAIRIGMSVPGLQFPFFVTMREEAEAAAAELGATIVFADALNDAAKQASDIENFIAQGLDAILISPMTTDALVPVIEQAVAAGIPVATVDRQANTDRVLVHVGADNVEGGRAAARFIIEQLGGSGSVIQLEGTPGASAAIDRKAGFDEVMAGSGITVLTSQSAEFDRARGQTVMENLIQAYPNFDAVFGANDEMIIGAIEAMQGSGVNARDKVTIGFDATPDAFAYIQNGLLDATIDQFPGQQAGQALQILVDNIRTGARPAQSVIFISPLPVTSAP